MAWTRSLVPLGTAAAVALGVVAALAPGAEPGAAAADVPAHVATVSTAPPVLFADGFESGDLSAWTGGSGLAVQQAVVDEGGWAARATMAGNAASTYRTLSSAVPELTASLRVRVVSAPTSSAVNFVKVRTASGSAIAEVYVTASGVLGVRNDVLGASTNSTRTLATGTWHRVALHVVVNGTASRTEVLLDGTTVLDLATDLGTAGVGRVQVGENVAGRTADLVYDAVAVTGPAPAPPPAVPALFADGFESGDLSAWTGGSGLAVQQAVVDEGGWAARGAMTGGAAFAYRSLGTAVDDLSVSVRVNRVSHAGSPAVNFLKLRTSTGAAIAEAYVTSSGLLGVRNAVTGVATNAAAPLPTGGWHTVVLEAVVAGPQGSARLALDGTTVLDLATDLGTAGVGRVQVGENVAGRTADLVYDAVAVTEAPPTTSSDPVLLAAGDIACDPTNGSFNGGAGTSNACRQRAVSDLVLAQTDVSVVAALGDIQYQCGGYEAFLASYDPSWGRFRAITRPAVGNHEYLDVAEGGPNATDCDPTGTATGYFTYFGAAAGEQGKGYYSYDLGAWHIVVLNTNCSDAGGCGSGSPQETWLRADLAAHPARCTMAYWHIPLWSSGGRAAPNSRALVKALVDAGAEVVLTGHDHTYERFAPMDSTGAATPAGVRQFVVGTGGAKHTSIPTVAANSEVRDASTFGVLRMVLHDDSYEWEFLPEAGGTFTDSGSEACH
ncbi:metallophosphoesterase [uncultured Phycicoccus sp.]|uniref:metallophosphoesterase family protein n=1 Tax=uncultured Phycicoccus sp. TaxID=661422 RepID=UPI00260564B2|nr:metallophosphoesterase [uncultured Phycicoccus sp.]